MKHTFRLAAVATALTLAFAPIGNSIAATTPAAPRLSAAPVHKALLAIADQYYDAAARFEPIGATENGDNRFDDQLGMSISPAKRAAQFKLYRGFAARLKTIKRAHLDTGDRINYDILSYELKGLLAMERFPEHLLPINQMDSVPVTLANYAGGEASQPIGTVKEYDAYLSRVAQLPAWIDQAIANMREGMKKGVTQPKAIMISACRQFKKLVSARPKPASSTRRSPSCRPPSPTPTSNA
jgi:uncharacterized protein (DUF885 family)